MIKNPNWQEADQLAIICCYLCCPSLFPSMSCKFREDGVALAEAILFEQACERPLKGNPDQLGSDFFRVTSAVLSSYFSKRNPSQIITMLLN